MNSVRYLSHQQLLMNKHLLRPIYKSYELS